MYNCQVCGKTVKANTRCFIIVTKTVDFFHPYRNKVHKIKIEDKWEYFDDPGGRGKQIKKEMKACPDCQHYSPELATY